MPAAPLVGAVTTRPPEAFSSLTASATRVDPVLSEFRLASGVFGVQAVIPHLRSPAHPEAARKQPFASDAPLFALNHDVAQVQQRGAYLVLGAATCFVAQRRFAN